MIMRRSEDALLRLGIFYPSSTGIHVISPQISAGNPNPFDAQVQCRLAAACEEAGLDFLFFADRWAPFGEHCTAAGFQDPFWYAPLLASACNTIAGLGKDVATVGDVVTKSAEDTK